MTKYRDRPQAYKQRKNKRKAQARKAKRAAARIEKQMELDRILHSVRWIENSDS